MEKEHFVSLHFNPVDTFKTNQTFYYKLKTVTICLPNMPGIHLTVPLSRTLYQKYILQVIKYVPVTAVSFRKEHIMPALHTSHQHTHSMHPRSSAFFDPIPMPYNCALFWGSLLLSYSNAWGQFTNISVWSSNCISALGSNCYNAQRLSVLKIYYLTNTDGL